jgi:8-amino-7-oxononanoate synthase
MVVIDDTQSLGIFGHSQGLRNPYGIGGGGSLQRQGVRDHRVVVVSSLAKAFGAPVAVLAGADHVVATFDRESETRMHCSPPSIAVIAAASRALSTNRLAGDAIRRVLGQRVTQLRSRLRDAQVVATKDLFPVQSLRMPEGVSAGPTYEALLERGIRTVLHRSTGDRSARLSFIIRATHGASEIEYAAAAVLELLPARAIQRTRRSEARCQASY